MKKKIVWMVVSGLMALSMVMAACGPAAVEEKEEEKEVIVVEEEEAVVVEEEEEVVSPEKPKYGGTLYLAMSGDIREFDPIDGC